MTTRSETVVRRAERSSKTRDRLATVLWLGGTLAVLVILVWANLRTTYDIIYVRYNEADFFEFGHRTTRGWPCSLAHFEPVAGKWETHPMRFMLDGLLTIAFASTAFQIFRMPAKFLARRQWPLVPKDHEPLPASHSD